MRSVLTSSSLLFAGIFADHVKVSAPFAVHQGCRNTAAVSQPLFATIPAAASSTSEATTSKLQQKSKVLESMLMGESLSFSEFLDTVWQTKPMVFSHREAAETTSTTKSKKTSSSEKGDGIFDPPKMADNPLGETIRQGWHVMVDLLERAPLPPSQDDKHKNNHNLPQVEFPRVIFPGHTPSLEAVMGHYGRSLFATYLDGGSVVQIHSDLISPWIAAICQDLQSIFPYVFAQTYLTPPFSQTLDPHADDRDVLVIQLQGHKEWHVYEQVPIPFPFPHEQVGKDPELPVPPSVLQGPTSIQQTLYPGDILYIPRGHVHQATSGEDLSFHITIAIATFDWTMAGAVHRLTQSILMQDQECRKSILPLHNDNENNDPKEQLQEQLDHAMNLLKEQITADSVYNELQTRIEAHRKRDIGIRSWLMEERAHVNVVPSSLSSEPCVGPQAAERVHWNSRLRAATPDEQKDVPFTKFFIRTETRDDLRSAMAQLHTDNSLSYSVSELLSARKIDNPYVCDLSLLSFAKQAVLLGELAIVDY